MFAWWFAVEFGSLKAQHSPPDPLKRKTTTNNLFLTMKAARKHALFILMLHTVISNSSRIYLPKQRWQHCWKILIIEGFYHKNPRVCQWNINDKQIASCFTNQTPKSCLHFEGSDIQMSEMCLWHCIPFPSRELAFQSEIFYLGFILIAGCEKQTFSGFPL